MFKKKSREKIKAHILCSVNFFFFRKSRRLWDNVEKYGRFKQVADDNKIRRMRFTCRMNKATDTRTQNMSYFLLPQGNSGYAKAR
jgi:hypothetical protein